MRSYTRAAIAAVTTLALATATTACATDDSTSGPADASQGTATSSPADASQGTSLVELEDGWVKATDTEMSGVFGTLRNTSGSDLHLTGVTGTLGGRQELHETVPGGSGMTMREKEDGFQIGSGSELVLEPGGNHIMLMDLTEPITTGQQIALTLDFADGQTQDVTVSARSFEGGNENYEAGGHGEHGGHGDMDNEGMDHGGMDHDG